MRGGLHEDPKIRRRQLEGLERGRAIAAERRRQGLPSKAKERELETRVIEGGNRGGGSQQRQQRREEQSNGGKTEKPPRQRRQQTQRTDRSTDDGAGAETEAGIPWFAPLYTGKRNSELLRELDES